MFSMSWRHHAHLPRQWAGKFIIRNPVKEYLKRFPVDITQRPIQHTVCLPISIGIFIVMIILSFKLSIYTSDIHLSWIGVHVKLKILKSLMVVFSAVVWICLTIPFFYHILCNIYGFQSYRRAQCVDFSEWYAGFYYKMAFWVACKNHETWWKL